MPSSPHDSRIGPHVGRSHGAATLQAHGDRWVVVIGVLKLLQGLFFMFVGFGAVHLIHRDLVGFLNHWIVLGLRLDPDSHAVNVLLSKAALIRPRDLRMLSLGIFLYATIDLTQGVGLVLEKVWAEYVTLFVTAAFLPWEFFELIRRVTPLRVGLVTVNLLIVLYLLWLVQANARRRLRRLVHRNSRL